MSPHRSDAAFSLGLAIDHWLAQKHRVTVLNCFTESEYAPYSDVDSLHAHDKKSFATAIRRKEDIAWNKLLGNRVQFHDLTLLDAPIRLACGLDDLQTMEIRSGDRAVARVAGAIEKLLKGLSPDQVAVAAPLAVGHHIDHRVCRLATQNVVAATGIPLAFYEDLPSAARIAVPEDISAIASELALDLEPVFAEAPLSDPSPAIAHKYKFAECYDSQVDSEEVHSIAEYARPLGGRERLWANPAWRASTLNVFEEPSA